jgi:hypothetical protein|tara:strand:+ start:184 stop:321 length:138 start_codon:yes stop_codon:yes gene_type:complete
MTKEEAINVLEEIKDNINFCCAITMEQDDVLDLIDKLEIFINQQN